MRRVHSIWGTVVFLGLFLFLFPFFLVLLSHENLKKHGWVLNKWWAKLFFRFSMISYEIENKHKLPVNQNYIFCVNHFSYLDIPSLGLLADAPFAFVGKHSIGKVPVFGFMYKKYHITVNRHNLKDSYQSLLKCNDLISKGYNLFIFPEGGIVSKNPPKMAKFKDGPFRSAIDKQIPVIPVTIAYNHIILPDDGKFLLNLQKHKCKIIIHEPLQTKGLNIADLDQLKAKTYQVINNELDKCNLVGVVGEHENILQLKIV